MKVIALVDAATTAPSKLLKRAGPLAAVLATLGLILVPVASSQGQSQYTDASGDNGTAADITGITVSSDTASGQILFHVNGTNLSTSASLQTELAIDSDANPLTGDISLFGADYWFGVDATGYGFQHWSGTDWVDTPNATVTISGGGSSLLISVNKSELGNTSDFNFAVSSWDSANPSTPDRAPDDGTFNYSLDAAGPLILAADVQTTPSLGPKAGRQFIVTPTGLKLPPNGASTTGEPKPDSYTCHATLKGTALAGVGTGGCTFRLPKKCHGKALKVVLSVTYEGATKAFTFPFRVL
jgi:hypothetical protein